MNCVVDSLFTDYIKGLSPSALDMELRMLQIIDDEQQQDADSREELASLELLLNYFISEISCRNNFEFIQALVRLFLKVRITLLFLLSHLMTFLINVIGVIEEFVPLS